MKHVTSIGYRRPRESGGPGQPFESCGLWVPAFAGMTGKRLILQESLRFRLLEVVSLVKPLSPERLEEALDVAGFSAGAGAARGVVNSCGERFLALLQFEHALFDCPLRDELVDEDGLVLADAVGAVGRLVLDGRVPPRVVMDDRVGGGQIEAGAASLETDQEQRHLALLEARDWGGTIFGVAAQFDKIDP